MTDHEIIEQFEKTWFYNRSITMDFFEAIPEDKWHYTHHPKYAALSKQFRHMLSVYGVYIEGFYNQAVDFGKKHSHFEGTLDRDSLRAGFIRKDEEMKAAMAHLKEKGIGSFKLDFFGVLMSFTEYSHVLVQHECMHIGIWSTVAATAGFELPQSWKSDWGFK